MITMVEINHDILTWLNYNLNLIKSGKQLIYRVVLSLALLLCEDRFWILQSRDLFFLVLVILFQFLLIGLTFRIGGERIIKLNQVLVGALGYK